MFSCTTQGKRNASGVSLVLVARSPQSKSHTGPSIGASSARHVSNDDHRTGDRENQGCKVGSTAFSTEKQRAPALMSPIWR